MSLLARLTDFQAGTIIASQPFDDEFNQLVNMLNGGSQNKSIRVRNNDSSLACARFDQLAANDILELFSGGGEVARIEQSGKFKSLVVTGTAPIDVNSITVCPNLNADLIDGIEGANIAKLDTNTFAFEFGWFIEDPSTFALTTQDLPKFICPDGTAMTVTKFKVVFSSGSHTVGGDANFIIRRRTAASAWVTESEIANISLNDTNNTINVVYTNDFVDVPLAAGDTLVAMMGGRSGTVSERKVSLVVMGTQRLT